MFGIDKSVVSTSHMEGQQNLIFFFLDAQYVTVFGLKTFRVLSVSFFAKRNMIQ